MTQRLVNYKEIGSILPVWSVSLQASLELGRKKGLFRRVHWQFNKKARCLIAFAVIVVVLVSCFALLYKPCGKKGDVVLVSKGNSTATSPNIMPRTLASPSPKISEVVGEVNGTQAASQNKPPGLIESAQTINSTVWKKVAANAWAYFQPGVGVDPNTGLPYAAGTGFPCFTDWDLGVYIQTVIDAQEIGLINATGTWGSTVRLNKVLWFLENRPLNATTHYPFWFYNATDGQDYYAEPYPPTEVVDVVDTGVLFVGLNNLINFNSSLTAQIDNIVFNESGNPDGGSNYAALLPAIESSASSNSIYAYLVASGFASFWPQQVGNVPNEILNNIVDSPTVISPYGNVTLPDAAITCSPLLLSIFELDNNDSRLMGLMNQVYLAHEAYYNATGKYVAFDEGNSLHNGYVYEWVVAPNGSTWQITNMAQNMYYNMNPVVYNDVAFGFLALYDSTYARNTVIFLEKALPTPTNGYSFGADNYGGLLTGVGDCTNGLILEAALYAVKNNS
jgi:hypothetical protein